MRKLHMISGLPRSGSTLLCNLLNMNPMFHATPTSAIMDSVKNIRSTFSHNPTWKTQDREALMDNMRMASKGFIINGDIEGFLNIILPKKEDILEEKASDEISGMSDKIS